MGCNSAISQYDSRLETVLRIISDFNSRDRQRPRLTQDQQCQMFPTHQKPTKPAYGPDNDFVLSNSPTQALSGSYPTAYGKTSLGCPEYTDQDYLDGTLPNLDVQLNLCGVRFMHAATQA